MKNNLQMYLYLIFITIPASHQFQHNSDKQVSKLDFTYENQYLPKGNELGNYYADFHIAIEFI